MLQSLCKFHQQFVGALLPFAARQFTLEALHSSAHVQRAHYGSATAGEVLGCCVHCEVRECLLFHYSVIHY